MSIKERVEFSLREWLKSTATPLIFAATAEPKASFFQAETASFTVMPAVKDASDLSGKTILISIVYNKHQHTFHHPSDSF